MKDSIQSNSASSAEAGGVNLLPCPHCGGKADFNNDGERWDQVICGSCGCRGCEYPSDKPRAAQAWNRRHGPAEVAALKEPAGGVG